MGEKYNGYTNYETWLVALWIDNDQELLEGTIPELAQAAYDNAGNNPFMTIDQEAAYKLGQNLKEYFEDANPLADNSDVWTDLLNSALSSVDWSDLGRHYFADFTPDTEQEETEND